MKLDCVFCLGKQMMVYCETVMMVCMSTCYWILKYRSGCSNPYLNKWEFSAAYLLFED